jgi:NADPH:quinone reductase-like Zn-dependent oxidoreductase
MFDIEVCEERKVGLVRFFNELTEADFETLDAIGRAAKGASAYDVVYDMSGIEHAHLATDFVSKRGRLPQANAGRQRFYVVPQHDLKLLVRLYAAYQASAGWQPPEVIDTLQEALDRLQVSRSDFKPYPLGGNASQTPG